MKGDNLTKITFVQASGADALELNLSCPHGMGERGMGLACGQVQNFLIDSNIYITYTININKLKQSIFCAVLICTLLPGPSVGA